MTTRRTIGGRLINTQTSNSLAIGALIAVNMIPVVGVVGFGWSVGAVILLYWFENAIIGAFNALKMLYAAGDESESDELTMQLGLERTLDIGFFSIHYGGFWIGHGVFVIIWFVDSTTLEAIGSWFVLALVGLVASHGVSFVRNYLYRGEFQTTTVDQLYIAPYRRVAALHITILAGGWFIDELGAPVVGVILLVLFKTVFDLYEHQKEHRRFGNDHDERTDTA